MPAPLPRLRDRLTLGRGGLRVSAFLQGMGDVDPSIVPDAYDAGINFFFVSADLHWPLYESIREGLRRLFARGRGIRDRVVVAAASYVVEPGTSAQAFRELLEAVPGLQRIDVLMAGMVREEEVALRLSGLRRLLERGEFGARATGASFHRRATAVRVHHEQLVDLVCLRSNPRHPGSLEDTFPHLDARSRSRLFVFKSMDGCLFDRDWKALALSEEHWRPRPPDYYRYALSCRQVDGVLMGLGAKREVRELGASLREGRLDQESRRYLIDLARLAVKRGLMAPPVHNDA
jgi:hypothetical protein